MLLSKAEITKILRKTTRIWNEDKDYLSKIDSGLGDGDHGITIGKIVSLTEKSLDGWDDDNMETFLEDLGGNTMEIEGGSAGSLYEIMIGELSDPLEGDRPTDVGTLREIFTECLSAMEDIIGTGMGDKIMMDTLTPIVETTQGAEDDAMAVLETAEETAAKGVKKSEQHVSKYGRARSYEEKAIDTSNARVVSTSLFLVGLCNGLK